MPLLEKTLLIIHIAGGSIALLSGLVTMVAKKGRSTHCLYGKIYFWGMTVVFVTGFTLSILISNVFLLMVSLFSYHAAASGYRILWRKKAGKENPAQALDWLIGSFGILSGIALITIGILFYINHNNNGIVPLVFGILSLVTAARQVIGYQNPAPEKTAWIRGHIGFMGASYIAASTAFLVNNAKYFPSIPNMYLWLIPAAVGVPIMMTTTRKWTKKPEALPVSSKGMN